MKTSSNLSSTTSMPGPHADSASGPNPASAIITTGSNRAIVLATCAKTRIASPLRIFGRTP